MGLFLANFTVIFLACNQCWPESHILVLKGVTPWEFVRHKSHTNVTVQASVSLNWDVNYSIVLRALTLHLHCMRVHNYNGSPGYFKIRIFVLYVLKLIEKIEKIEDAYFLKICWFVSLNKKMFNMQHRSNNFLCWYSIKNIHNFLVSLKYMTTGSEQFHTSYKKKPAQRM